MSDIKLIDNSDAFLAEIERRVPVILEALGKDAVKFAKGNIRDKGYIDTGTARNSINYAVSGGSVYVGSNLEYFPYLENGTGIHAADGKGRKGWWVYVLNGDKDYQRTGEKRIYTEEEAKRIAAILRSQGLDAHATNGIKPGHMIRDAIANHKQDYEKRVKQGFGIK